MARALQLLLVGSGLLALGAAGPLRASELVEGAIAAPGECAHAPEVAPPGPARSPISALFPPAIGAPDGRSPGAGNPAQANIDVAAGGSPDVAGGPGFPGSSDPGRPIAPIFAGPGPCDQPGSGCAGSDSLRVREPNPVPIPGPGVAP